jgi:hypothetical protein
MAARRRRCPPEESRRRSNAEVCSAPSALRRGSGTFFIGARAPQPARGAVVLALCLGLLAAPGARAGEERVAVDRVAIRFTAPETGSLDQPQFIFERELAFEARLEALSDGGFRVTDEEPYVDRHVRAALERHMAEVLLSRLEITPEPTPRELGVRIRAARQTLAQQLGGDAELERARLAEDIAVEEVERLLGRRARASLYLDRMVATMLTPSDTELRIVHRTTRTPFSGAAYETVAPMLQRWYVAQRLNTAVRAFYEGARSRLQVTELVGSEPRDGSTSR